MKKPNGRTGGFRGKGPNGRNLCFCGCGNEVPKGRSSWFSHEHWIRNVPSFMRRIVFKRDKGICSICFKDTGEQHRIDKCDFLEWSEERALLVKNRQIELIRNKHSDTWGGAYDAALKVFPIPERFKRLHKGQHCWEMDHIVPVVKGGGNCGLENLRTLCIACHRRVTKELAAERALERKRNAAQLEFSEK